MTRAAGVYQTLLRCYPAVFREEYGDQMLLMFVAQLGQARRNGNVFDEAKLWTQAALDVLTVAPKEHCHVIFQDLRYALRGLRRNPIFTIAIVASLTLGIGSATAVFSVVDRVLFRSLPYDRADRLVSLGLVQSLEKNEFVMGNFYYAWRDQQTPFSAVTSQSVGPHACDLTQVNPAHLNCIRAEANFLPTLGVSPALGRNFTNAEDQPNGAGVALISYSFWRSHFHLDRGVLHKLIRIDGEPLEIVGVLPESFEMPTLQPFDIIRPMDRDEAAERNGTQPGPRRAFARLKPGVSVRQAILASEPLFAYAQQQMPRGISRNDFHLSVRSLRDRQMQDFRLTSWVLFASVLAVLLIACANAASLLMARGTARERELAIRSTLGASRARLFHQAITEALLLSTIAATAGFALAWAMLRSFVAVAPAGVVPLLSEAALDLRIVLFALTLALVCGVLFSILPALERPRPAALTARTSSSVPRAFSLRLIVAGQIAISIVLLTSATLLIRSLWNLQQQNLGIQTRNVVTTRIDLPSYRYARPGQVRAFFEQAMASAGRIPGVTAVAVSSSLPPEPGHDARHLGSIAVAGRTPRPASAGSEVVGRNVTSGYFKALGIAILRGSGFTEKEERSNQRFVVLSQLLSSYLFPMEDPIGRAVYLDHEESPSELPYTVVGVAADVKNAGLADADEPEFYRLRRDMDEDWASSAYLIVETAFPATTTAAWLRDQLVGIDATLPLDIQTMTQQVGALASRPRFEAMVLSCFAATGLLMAVIGLYGVTAFIAARRTHEIGIRMAVGASRADILLLFLRESLPLIGFGGLLGFMIALALSRMLHSMLFGIGPRDPASFVAVSLLLAVVALAAVLLPAVSAMRVGPTVALREE